MVSLELPKDFYQLRDRDIIVDNFDHIAHGRHHELRLLVPGLLVLKNFLL